MITEKDLLEAIAECQGQRNPNSSTCLKLASYYTILDHVKSEEKTEVPSYSFSPVPDIVSYKSNSEFSQEIQNLDDYTAWSIMDELMDTLSVVNPKLYNSVMRKIKGGL